MTDVLGRAELLMKSAKLGMTCLGVLLDPEVCLMHSRTELVPAGRAGHGPRPGTHSQRPYLHWSRRPIRIQGGDRAGRVTGAVEGKAQGVPVGGTFRICLDRLAYQSQAP